MEEEDGGGEEGREGESASFACGFGAGTPSRAGSLREAMGAIELLSGFLPEGSADRLRDLVRGTMQAKKKTKEPTDSELSRKFTALLQRRTGLERNVGTAGLAEEEN